MAFYILEVLDGKVQILETAEEAIEEQDISQAQSTENSVEESTETQSAEELSDEQKPELCYDNPVSVPKNSVVQLTAALQSEGSEAEITWSSDNESLASVDENGKLTLYNEEGAATITAKTDNGLEAILTVDITKTEEELANEKIAKALAEIAKEIMTEEEAQAKIEEMQSKYGALPESQKQAIAPAVDHLKTAVQQKQQSKQQAVSSGNANTDHNHNAASGMGSSSSNSGNTGGGSSGNGETPTPSPAPAPTPQPVEKYYPTMTPAEMESYAKSYAESIGLVYDPRGNIQTWSWSAPTTTSTMMSNEAVKADIVSGINSAKRHGATEVRCIAEANGVTDSAGNPQYRIYITEINFHIIICVNYTACNKIEVGNAYLR